MNRPLSTSPAAAPAAAQAPDCEPRWHVQLLGAMQACDGVQRVDRFPSRAVAVLLARIALQPARMHSREELIELLWPGVSLATGRNRLRQALSTLKSLLEPAGDPWAAVLQADRLGVRAVAGALSCDAVDFERAVRVGNHAQAQALYIGELMPGHYDDWVVEERLRLAALHEQLSPPGPPEVSAPPLGRATLPAAPTPSTLPAWLPVAPLPKYLTRLFGADITAARLRALIVAQRLVTLLGPGGSGKTRLALEVAQALRQFGSPPGSADLASLWPGDGASGRDAALPFERIAFVPLVSCEEASQMLGAIARALRLAGSDSDPAAQLAAVLGDRRVLLVLDNFEQLVGRAEAEVASLLALLPGRTCS